VLLVFEGYFGSFSIAMVRLFGWPTVGAVKGRFSYLAPNEIAPHLGIPQSDRGGTAGAATSRAGRDDLRMALGAIWTGPDRLPVQAFSDQLQIATGSDGAPTEPPFWSMI
jgi:hypothetical protein